LKLKRESERSRFGEKESATVETLHDNCIQIYKGNQKERERVRERQRKYRERQR
jgi:hypothetical protein